MTNDQQHDLYRFLAYVGLTFITAAFLLPWLFIYQQSSVIISQESYNNLTQNSKVLSTKLVNLNLFIIDGLPFFSLALFVIGVLIVVSGFKKWSRKS